MTIERIAVIGAGTMGHGIAYVALASGYAVNLADADAATLAAGTRRIEQAFDKAIDRGKATQESRERALARLTAANGVREAAEGVDLVIEAVPERLELKQSIFRDLARVVSPQTILASNTSSLSITRIADGVASPDRVVGLHFFNPVPVMKLLEIVRGEQTSELVIDAARRFATTLGKTSIVVRDSPGFATSRLGVVLGLEAIRMLEQGVASAEDIDRAMELGYNHPMGPLRLTDVVGLDVRLAIAEHLHATLGDDTYKPPALLRRLVAEGKLGKKSGRGFYSWENDR
jgi:3-hydroxybutyryl-CoA dehydrogenase